MKGLLALVLMVALLALGNTTASGSGSGLPEYAPPGICAKVTIDNCEALCKLICLATGGHACTLKCAEKAKPLERYMRSLPKELEQSEPRDRELWRQMERGRIRMQIRKLEETEKETEIFNLFKRGKNNPLK